MPAWRVRTWVPRARHAAGTSRCAHLCVLALCPHPLLPRSSFRGTTTVRVALPFSSAVLRPRRRSSICRGCRDPAGAPSSRLRLCAIARMRLTTLVLGDGPNRNINLNPPPFTHSTCRVGLLEPRRGPDRVHGQGRGHGQVIWSRPSDLAARGLGCAAALRPDSGAAPRDTQTPLQLCWSRAPPPSRLCVA